MIITFASWRGVGTTTAAFAIATALRDDDTPVWLVEADPAGGVLSGRLPITDGVVGGLERLAFPFDDVNIATRLGAVAHHVGDVSIVTTPADPFRAHACHRPRVDWVSALSDLDGVVCVDIGRLRVGTPVWPIIEAATCTVVVTNPEVAAVVSSVEWLRDGGRIAGTETGLGEGAGRIVVVDAPGGVGFPRHRLETELGDELLGWLPWDVAGVDLLQRGVGGAHRNIRKAGVLESARSIAHGLRVMTEVSA